VYSIIGPHSLSGARIVETPLTSVVDRQMARAGRSENKVSRGGGGVPIVSAALLTDARSEVPHKEKRKR
jgi:hypothetical protein